MTPHGALLAVLLLEAAAIPIVAAIYGALPRREPAGRAARILPPVEALAALALGLLGMLGIALLAGGRARGDLAAGAALGTVYLALLALLAAGIGRSLVRAGAAPGTAALLAAAVPAALFGAIFVAGPLLALAGTPEAGVAWTLRLSSVAVLAGSCLEVDLLRTAPLYGLAPFASDRPFAYAAPGTAILAIALPAGLAALAGALGRAPAKAPAAVVANAGTP